MKVFTINKYGDHLGHVTCTIYISFLSYFPRRLHIKFGFDWSSGFKEEEDFCFLFLLFFIQFNVPFKISSLIETSQWVGGAKREYPGKTT